MDQAVLTFNCSFCLYQTRSQKELLSHYALCHEHEPNFSITCPQRNCHRQFKTIRCLRRHLKIHTEVELPIADNQDFQPGLLENPDADVENHHNNAADVPQNHVDYQDMQVDDEENMVELHQKPFQKVVASTILALRERQKVPYKTCGSFLQLAGTIVQQSDKELLDDMKNILQEENVPNDTANRILSVLDNNATSVVGCIQDFEDPVKLNNYVEKNLNFVKPVEFYLGATNSETMQYVPILDNLKALLHKEDILAEVLNPHSSNDGWFRDICDGEHFKMHPFWQSDQTLLQIILYFDEFTAVIQNGCHAARYKFGGIYYQLGNIRPSLRSQLHCMQLAILAKSKSIKTHGLSVVLEPLIADLKRLETEGILLETPNGNRLFHGSVLVVLSDNLGSHMIGNFLTSFVANRSCRFCMITRPELQTMRDISNCTRRTEDQYDMQADLVTQDPGLKGVYGISGKSPMNALSHYHVASGLPPDMMHDLFEAGLVTDVLQLLVTHYIHEGVIDLPGLCTAIGTFNFKAHDKINKPEVAVSNGHFVFKQKSSQVFCLLRMFPFILGPYIALNDDKWELLLSLKQMVDILLSTELSPAGVEYMGDLINHFHSVYQKEFPDVNLKPKGHYTLHYKELVKKFGILKNLWTMRFEGKHSFFIDIARRTKNRKNLCKTFAMRHQYLQCVFLESDNFLSSGAYEITGSQNILVENLTQNEKDLVQPLLGNSPTVLRGDALRFQGCLYNSECALVRGFHDDDIQFAVVNCVFLVRGTPMIFCKKMDTVEFNRHFQAYFLQSGNEFMIAKVHDLPDYHPLPLYTLQGRPCTVLHHYISFE